MDALAECQFLDMWGLHQADVSALQISAGNITALGLAQLSMSSACACTRLV
jgi:hypothetical protein